MDIPVLSLKIGSYKPRTYIPVCDNPKSVVKLYSGEIYVLSQFL